MEGSGSGNGHYAGIYLEGLRKAMKNPNDDNWCTDRASDQVPNKYISRAVPLHHSAGKLQIYEDCITSFGVLENYVFWHINPHKLQKLAPTGKNLLAAYSEQKRLHCSYLFYPEDRYSSFLQNLWDVHQTTWYQVTINQTIQSNCYGNLKTLQQAEGLLRVRGHIPSHNPSVTWSTSALWFTDDSVLLHGRWQVARASLSVNSWLVWKFFLCNVCYVSYLWLLTVFLSYLKATAYYFELCVTYQNAV